jgi:coenzyme F420-0:L-glutamate ligase/coenzyme F420-1:gamma-L-glutamate ligase
VTILPVPGIGEVVAGQALGELIAGSGLPEPGDAVCISQKIVSKAEGRVRDLDEVDPSPRAIELGDEVGKSAELVELILAESRRIVRADPGRGILIVETHSGLVCANAGIDSSNVPGDRHVALLPVDADVSARRIRAELVAALGFAPAVVIADSFGRPWRVGQSEVAIGCAGIEPLDDWRGRADRDGRTLASTAIAVADQIAAAADLARDKASGTPVVLVRGLGVDPAAPDGPGAAALVRPGGEDLFR